MSNDNNLQGNQDYAFGNISLNLGGLTDDLTMIGIQPLDLSSYTWSNSTLTGNGPQGASGTFSLPPIGVGAVGASSSPYNYINPTGTLNLGNPSSWTPPAVKIENTGIEMIDSADIKIGNRSLKTFMEKVEDRLAILQPDPELMEKFEALKQAYEHYKTLEALCTGNIPKDPNGK